MTTAHRPTFDPARGRDAQRGPAYHQRLLPAHQTLKYRQATQGTTNENSGRDLRAELLRAERIHHARKAGRLEAADDEEDDTAHLADMTGSAKRALPNDQETEDYDSKRRRVLEATRDVDAESDKDNDAAAADSDSDDESDQDSEDETAELMRELDKIKRERAGVAAKEAAEKAQRDAQRREAEVATGNPLLAATAQHEYGVKRRWDDDVVFKNQARGTSEREKGKSREFVNDLLRSDFHKRFMSRYVR